MGMGRRIDNRVLPKSVICITTFPKIPYLCALISAVDEHWNSHLDVSLIDAGWSGSGYSVVFPKQETTLRQSLDNHFVCTTDYDGRLGGFVAFQPADSAEIQLGGDAYNHPRARQFFVRRPLQGFSFLQKGLSYPV